MTNRATDATQPRVFSRQLNRNIIRSIHQERALSSREPERSTRRVLAGTTAKGRSLTVFYGKGCAKFQKTCVTRTAEKGRNSLCHHYSANRVCSSPLRNNHRIKRSGTSETTKNSGPPRR